MGNNQGGLGDINLDGSINILDAVILVNFVLGFQIPLFVVVQNSNVWGPYGTDNEYVYSEYYLAAV